MRLLYVKPELRDLSQGARIAFVRELRHLSQVKNTNKPEIKLLINSLQEWKRQMLVFVNCYNTVVKKNCKDYFDCRFNFMKKTIKLEISDSIEKNKFLLKHK